MSGVISLQAAGASIVDGALTLVSTQPGLLTIGSSGTNISFAPVSASVNSLNGKNGNPVLTSLDSTLTISAPVGNAINISGSTPTTGVVNLKNLTTTNGGAWVSAGYYPKGAMAFSVAFPKQLYISRQDQASSLTDPALDPADWLLVSKSLPTYANFAVPLTTTTSGAGGYTALADFTAEANTAYRVSLKFTGANTSGDGAIIFSVINTAGFPLALYAASGSILNAVFYLASFSYASGAYAAEIIFNSSVYTAVQFGVTNTSTVATTFTNATGILVEKLGAGFNV